MAKAKSNFSAGDIAKLNEAQDKEHAQELLKKIVEAAATSEYPIKPEKVAYLQRQIGSARSKNDVVAIGYNMLLAGEGLSSVSSGYQKRYG